MSDANAANLAGPDIGNPANDVAAGDNRATEYFSTPEFQSALDDADVLLGYAASTGQLPSSVQGIVEAQHASRASRVTPGVAIAFWPAFAVLSKSSRPVTAASIRASEKASLLEVKLAAIILVVAIITFSIFLFMNNSTAVDTSDLIDQQNKAALQLWADLQLLESGAKIPEGNGQSPSAPPNQGGAAISQRVFEQTVEFARRSDWLLQSASRLHYWFNPWWTNIDVKPVTFNKDNPQKIDHLWVPPDISSPAQIATEVVNQIKAYQAIRNYAQSLYKTDTIIYGGITTYLLPTIYALLGALLYGFRFYARLIRRKAYLPSAAHSARYFIAAIAGLVVGLFGSMLPKSLATPLAVAFLVGYAVEAFFSRLDDMIVRFKGEMSAKQESTPGEQGAD